MGKPIISHRAAAQIAALVIRDTGRQFMPGTVRAAADVAVKQRSSEAMADALLDVLFEREIDYRGVIEAAFIGTEFLAERPGPRLF